MDAGMRIIYGCNSQGQGHLGKAAVLVPLLEARGHEVRVISSGPTPPANYQFTWHKHVAGLVYAIENGHADVGRTLRNWLQSSPSLLHSLKTLRRLIRDFKPELMISDFEPLTASPLLDPPCQVVSVCRQVALLDPQVATPAPTSTHARLVRTMIRLFTLGADRKHGYHYSPQSHRCVPPIIRPELFSLRPTLGEHIVIYNHHFVLQGEAERLIAWASDRRIAVRAYGFDDMPRGQAGYVRFQPSSRQQMLLDLASSRGVITTAGLTTPAEGFLLGKPVCVVPLPDQWEQQANAIHLQDAGMAVATDSWDYDRVLETPAPTDDHPGKRWLTTDADTVLDVILGTPAAATSCAA
jgi:uncharacterized protein (TIGR00661 family)